MLATQQAERVLHSEHPFRARFDRQPLFVACTGCLRSAVALLSRQRLQLHDLLTEPRGGGSGGSGASSGGCCGFGNGVASLVVGYSDFVTPRQLAFEHWLLVQVQYAARCVLAARSGLPVLHSVPLSGWHRKPFWSASAGVASPSARASAPQLTTRSVPRIVIKAVCLTGV